MPPLSRSKLYLRAARKAASRGGESGKGEEPASGGQQRYLQRCNCLPHLWKSSPVSHFLFQWKSAAKSPQNPCNRGNRGVVSRPKCERQRRFSGGRWRRQ